ncbi:transmembrane protein 70 homolog, mitochondrial [Cherax quadricarinatus]|uniref:transmembrane protein 70 homolog, mitochondrial n=1 Tax=Cherax quadricarinatus TaxID=27406 RepID=UPI00387E4D96
MVFTMARVCGLVRPLQHFPRDSCVPLLKVPSVSSCIITASLYTRIKERQLICWKAPQRLLFIRKFSNKEIKTSSSNTEPKVDIGPGTWKEIYHGILSTQIKMVKTFSLSTSFLGLMVQPVLLQKVVGTQMGVILAVGSFVGFFTFITPLIIHWITKKYVTCLEYDPEKDMYSATTLSFFLRRKKIHFHIDDVKVPDVPGMFTTFLVKDRPLFVDPNMFEDLEHYGRLMGYNKPVNFHLGEPEKKDVWMKGRCY